MKPVALGPSCRSGRKLHVAVHVSVKKKKKWRQRHRDRKHQNFTADEESWLNEDVFWLGLDKRKAKREARSVTSITH